MFAVLAAALLALSGQRYRKPDQSLTFMPKLSPPYELPVLVPRTVATLTARPATSSGGGAAEYELRVVSGMPISLKELSVNGSSPSGGLPVKLGVGDWIKWTAGAAEQGEGEEGEAGGSGSAAAVFAVGALN